MTINYNKKCNRIVTSTRKDKANIAPNKYMQFWYFSLGIIYPSSTQQNPAFGTLAESLDSPCDKKKSSP
jgi:hypothetical protein